MSFLHEWIEQDLEAELQRLDEASAQVRKQRNQIQTERTRELWKHSRLKAQLKAELLAKSKSQVTLKPGRTSIPKSEHRKLPYDQTLVEPTQWTPPRHIQSPLRDAKQYVQIVQITSDIVPGKPFNAVVSDGIVSIPAFFKPNDGWCTSTNLIRPGAIFQIKRYLFRFPGSCSNSWEEGITRYDQLYLARSKIRKPQRPFDLKYPSVAVSIGTYQWENNFFPADGLLLDIEISKVLRAESPVHQEPPSVEENWRLMDIVNKFPVLPIRIPGLDLWSSEIIQEVARIWHLEVAWLKFSRTLTSQELRKLPEIKAAFSQQFRTNDETTFRAVRRARKFVFESIYHDAGPIGRLFEIRRAYKILQTLLKNKSRFGISQTPATQRPIPSQVGSNRQPKIQEDLNFDEDMTGTPLFATQFPPALRTSGVGPTNKEFKSIKLDKRIGTFGFDSLDRRECEDFSEIIRTLYEKAREDEFHEKEGILSIYRHISDFYATKILQGAKLNRVEPGTSEARTSHITKAKKIEPTKNTKRAIERPAERPQAEAARKHPTITPPSNPHPSGREKLVAALAMIKKTRGIEASQRIPGNQQDKTSPAVPKANVTKKASRTSLSGRGGLPAPVVQPSTPSAGEPMEGVVMESNPQVTSNGLVSKKGRLNTLRSTPTSLESLKSQTAKKSTAEEPSGKRQGHDRLSGPDLGTKPPSRAPVQPTASESTIVLDSTQAVSGKAAVDRPKEARDPSPRVPPLHTAPKALRSDIEQKVPVSVEREKRKPAPPESPFEVEHEHPRSTSNPRKKSQIQRQEKSSSTTPSSRPKPPVEIKKEPSDVKSFVTESPEVHGPTETDSGISAPPQAASPEGLLTKLHKMLELLRTEKEQDNILPERTKVPEDQAEILSKNSALWPPPKKELQKHMRVLPDLRPKDDGPRKCLYPEDFEPYNSTIETSSQPGTPAKQKVIENQPKPSAKEQHVFTLTNQPLEDSDDEPVEWAATPPSQLKDPLDRENEVFENSDAESYLDPNPPVMSSAPTPAVTPKKVKSVIVQTNTPLSSLRKTIAEKTFTPPKVRAWAIPIVPTSPIDSEADLVPAVPQMPSITATQNTSDLDEEEEEEEKEPEPKYEEVEDGQENEYEKEEGYDEEEFSDGEDGEEEESEVQVLQTQSSPAHGRQTPHLQEPQVAQPTPRVPSSSQMERPGTPRGSPSASKRKADEISVSPVKVGSEASPRIIRGPKILKMEDTGNIKGLELGKIIVEQANAAIKSSNLRSSLGLSEADLAKGMLGKPQSTMARLAMEREAYLKGNNGDSDSDSDSDWYGSGP